MKNTVSQRDEQVNLKARKFLMWLFIVSSFIYFAGLTSGFIVYTSGSANRGIKTLLPYAFRYSTIVIIISSLTMHMAYQSGKKLQFKKQQIFLLLTMALGIAFFAIQLLAWQKLIAQGVYFVSPNASQSFIYVFTGSHLVHIFAGISMLLAAWIGKIRNIPQVRNMFRLEVASIFWHFIDILWIYLYVFLLLNQ